MSSGCAVIVRVNPVSPLPGKEGASLKCGQPICHKEERRFLARFLQRVPPPDLAAMGTATIFGLEQQQYGRRSLVARSLAVPFRRFPIGDAGSLIPPVISIGGYPVRSHCHKGA